MNYNSIENKYSQIIIRSKNDYDNFCDEKDKAIINELYCVYNPLFKLNKEEIEIANETDGHLAKHISRDTSIFPFYIKNQPSLLIFFNFPVHLVFYF